MACAAKIIEGKEGMLLLLFQTVAGKVNGVVVSGE